MINSKEFTGENFSVRPFVRKRSPMGITLRCPSIGAEDWDGTFNDQEVPNGVYIYQAEVLANNGLTERIMGVITLIR